MIEVEKITDFFKRNRIEILVFFVYSALTIFFLSHLIRGINYSLVPGDGLFTYWTIRWDVYSFLHDPLNLFNSNIFYPNENTLAYSEGLFVPALIALPIFLVIRDMVVTYNLLIFFSYILSAFGAYKLAKYYTKNNYASFIAGLIFGFSTFKLVSIGHFQNIMTFWMPFAVLHLQKYLDSQKRKYALYFALLFSAQMLSSWNMGVFFALFVIFLLVANWKIIRENLWPMAKDGLVAIFIILLLVVPFAYPYFKLHLETEFSYPVEDMIHGSADLGGYILPPPGTNMAKLTFFLGIEKGHWGENMNFIGWFSIMLLLYYFFIVKEKIVFRNFKIYALGIPIFAVLSFGPVLRFVPNVTIPSFYALLVPVLGFVRTPSRLAVIVVLCLSIAIAYIVGSIRIKNNLLRIALLVFVSVFILFEFWVPRGKLFMNTECPDIYERVKNDPSVSAIVEMPIQERFDSALPYVYYSTCHLKPIFNGYSGSAPKNYTKNAKVLRGFPDKDSLKLIRKINITHVLLHLSQFSENRQKPLMEAVQSDDALEIREQFGDDFLIKIRRD